MSRSGDAYGKRAQQQRVNQAEDGRVRADPERQREDHDDGESRPRAQTPDRVTQLANDQIELEHLCLLTLALTRAWIVHRRSHRASRLGSRVATQPTEARATPNGKPMSGPCVPVDGQSRPLVGAWYRAPPGSRRVSGVMLHDLRLALRACLRRPASSAAVVITLAVALGATTAIVSLVYALILRPLPFPDADRLVQIDPVIASDAGRLSLREYRDLERDSQTLDRWAAYYRSQYNLTGGGAPEALTCTIGTSTLFDALGVKPVHGDIWPRNQDFTRQYQVVLSHRLWQQRFAGRLDAVGSTLVMDGGTYRVAGVLPEGVDYPLRTDIFRAITDYNAPHVRRYSALARLKPGVTLAQAQAELDAIARRFAATWPDTNTGVTLRATPLRDAYVGARAAVPVAAARRGWPAAGDRVRQRDQPAAVTRDGVERRRGGAARAGRVARAS